ncbi:MAG: hypothetical protein H7039_13910 [Bryobacteraceae bacterium]|nr:hypothetical protein [Bryobacteraceae bacterium]
MSEDPKSSPDDLQFRKAEPLPEPDTSTRCVSCNRRIDDEYFHAQGQPVCPECAAKIESGQKAPPPVSLALAILYGSLAALAGMVLYAGIAIATGLEIGFISIVVGIMVGRAVRAGSHGLGGRPQQILAVALTYFAISVSSVPVYLWHGRQSSQQAKQEERKNPAPVTTQPQTSPMALVAIVLVLGLTSPFLMILNNPVASLLSLVILFFGLQQAWSITGRTDILVTGPYKLDPLP